MAKRLKPAKATRPARKRPAKQERQKTTALKNAEKKITKLEGELERAKDVTTAVLDAEIERSKQIAADVREQLRRIRKQDS